MASEIKQWKLYKVRGDRGYHIYRFSNLPIGLVASNSMQHSRVYSYWNIAITKIKEANNKFYTTGKLKKLGYSPSKTPSWKSSYAKESLNWLNENKSFFWDFVFNGQEKP